MNKREIIIALSSFAVAILIVLAGWFWHGHQNSKTTLNNSGESSEASDGASPLSVNVAGASDLGQLGANGDQSSGSKKDSSSNNGGIDPTSFAQYDKYKDNKDALFGDIQKGSGAELTLGKKATLTYKGWLTNGALIDQSPLDAKGQPQPFTFTLGNHEVIPGWEEAIYGMKAGGSRIMIIPPSVGYGAQGKGSVPPNAVLVFQVQLLSVQ